MSVLAGLTATKAALDVAKLTMDKLNSASIDVHGVRSNVQEMLIHVVNAQVSLGEAQTEIAELREEIRNRDALKSIEADLEYQKDGGFYLRKSDGAFCCPTCWGDRQRVVPITPMANGRFRCPIHESSYETEANKEKQQRIIDEAN